jgi:predicted small secreted protein
MMRLLKTARSTTFVFALAAIALLLAACNGTAQSSGSFASLPAGRAYTEGKEIFFSHTETSDAGIAEKLSNMMKSPVLHVPALADVPASALADVYVFENGLTGKGPLGFQPDVFNNPPGTPGYSPLRQIILVKWADGAQVSELKSAAEVAQAETAGLLTTTKPGVIVNMPFMVWDGGKR